MKTRVLVADDHSVVLEGLRNIIEAAGCETVGTAEDGRELVRLVTELKPDLVVLDISMPVLNGVEAARQIRMFDSAVKLLFLSMHSDPVYVREAFRAGANGYLLKRTAVSELRNAITAIMEGRVYVSPQVTNKNVDELLAAPAAGSFGSDLTARQRQVLQLVAEGKTAKEIAATLNISTKTVEFHKTSIMDALGMRTIAQLTRYALDHKIVGV